MSRPPRWWWALLSLHAAAFWFTGCADKHALQVGVTCKYPDGPTFDQETHGRVLRAGDPRIPAEARDFLLEQQTDEHLRRIQQDAAKLHFWLVDDQGTVEIR